MAKEMLRCSCCKSVLKLTQSYTGCDWDCEAGEGSGYDVEIALGCDNCGMIYPLGHVREPGDFSPVIRKLKTYK